MIVTAIQCEMCPKTHQLGNGPLIPPANWPDGWLVIVERYKEDHHFCSRGCLMNWLGMMHTCTRVDVPAQETLLAPATKMRRFLLVDGETAEEFEGVVFSSGRVVVNVQNRTDWMRLFFHDWSDLKASHPGDGVTWIDQEIREEVPV